LKKINTGRKGRKSCAKDAKKTKEKEKESKKEFFQNLNNFLFKF
jgi:hypothetical protein